MGANSVKVMDNKTKKKTKKQVSKVVTDVPKEMVTIHIMGKGYRVPAEATIMGAIEYAGYQIKRGAGCREGFCGACGTVFKVPDDYKIHTGLACTTLVQDGMLLAQLPFIPNEKPAYDIDTLSPDVTAFQKVYPEVFRCVACNTCTKACPQDLQVMDYIQTAMRGDIEKTMDLSFDCVSCGLCAIRCPAEIVQFNVGILAKRLYGKYLAPESPELSERLKEMKDRKFDDEYNEMAEMSYEDMKTKYYDRDME
jgi:formate hydrogenlyase subunit 6/NADH:ubiquinone oxidoreductase subunit I